MSVQHKKIDPRIRTLLENGIQLHHRSFFVVVGDRGRDQVINLHRMLSKAIVGTQPSVLWCYKNELGFSSYGLALMCTCIDSPEIVRRE